MGSAEQEKAIAGEPRVDVASACGISRPDRNAIAFAAGRYYMYGESGSGLSKPQRQLVQGQRTQ